MSPHLPPLDIEVSGTEARWKARIPYLVWGFLALGTAIRLIGYLLRFPLWVDECFLAENLLDRGFLDLVSPLENNQVAPVGFLWVELAAVRLFGFSEWSLRLFPLLCGIGSLFVFRNLASRLLAGFPLVFAVGCLAVAKAPIGLSANVKPYATDLFVAVTVVTLAVEWLRRPERTLWMWSMAAVIPLALALSYPAVFVGGAVSLGLLGPVCRSRCRNTWVAYCAYNVSLCASFAGVLSLNSGPQFAQTQAFMNDYWKVSGGFPPAEDPASLIRWLIDIHLGDTIFSVPYGAENGGGIIWIFCCGIAAVIMYRRGQRPVLTIFLAMFSLALVAAALQRYPYGGHNRLVQFLVPGICITAGLGVATLLARVSRDTLRGQLTAAILLLMVLFGAGLCARDCTHPYHYALDERHRSFARQFWREEPECVTICSQTDLEWSFCQNDSDSYYRCNQRIYSPPHHAGQIVPADAIDGLHRPIRLVVFHPPNRNLKRRALADHLEQVFRSYESAGREMYPMPLNDDQFDKYGSYEVLRFVPRQKVAQTTGPGSQANSPPR